MAEASADLANTLEAESFTTLLVDPLSDDEAGKNFSKGNLGAKSGDNNLSLSDYNSDALEVPPASLRQHMDRNTKTQPTSSRHYGMKQGPR
jgi:hypothetical protein